MCLYIRVCVCVCFVETVCVLLAWPTTSVQDLVTARWYCACYTLHTYVHQTHTHTDSHTHWETTHIWFFGRWMAATVVATLVTPWRIKRSSRRGQQPKKKPQTSSSACPMDRGFLARATGPRGGHGGECKRGVVLAKAVGWGRGRTAEREQVSGAETNV